MGLRTCLLSDSMGMVQPGCLSVEGMYVHVCEHSYLPLCVFVLCGSSPEQLHRQTLAHGDTVSKVLYGAGISWTKGRDEIPGVYTTPSV